VSGGPAEHVFGFDSDRDDDFSAPGGLILHRDDRRFVQNNTALANVNQRVGGSKVD
jgi:hypothetical protein